MADAETLVLERFYELSSNAAPISELREFAEANVSDDFEMRTRDGVVKGVQPWFDFVESQRRQFEIRQEVQETLAAGGGIYVVLLEVLRRGKDPTLGEMKAWPAHLWRFRDGKVAFFEGYQNRAKAMRDAGLER